MICARSLSTAPAVTTASRCLLSLSFLPLRRNSLSSSAVTIRIRMSSSQIFEHVVLFNVKEGTDPSQVNAMVNGLSSLRALDGVLHLTVGPVLRLRSPPPLTFTHMLHSRYPTKEDLAAYSAHPNHLGVVKENVLPICDGIMAVDWVTQQELDGPLSPPPGSAMKVQLLKLKEGKDGEAEKGEVIGVIGGLKEKVGGIEQISFGENFSPARAKGFSICSIGVFSGLGELEKLEGSLEIEKQKDQVRNYIDGLIVVDYVLPNAQPASL